MKRTVTKLLKPIAVAAATLTLAAVAHADTYDFSLTGDYTAHWQLSSMPSVDESQDGKYFGLWDVPGTFQGAVSNLADMGFFTDAYSGGLVLIDFTGGNTVLFGADSVQLYTGTEDTPTFKLGTFALTSTDNPGSYSLTISNVSAVPEPESYALLLSGLGVMGFIAARRRSA